MNYEIGDSVTHTKYPEHSGIGVILLVEDGFVKILWKNGTREWKDTISVYGEGQENPSHYIRKLSKLEKALK